MANIEDFDSSCCELNYKERTYPIRGKIIVHFAMLEKNIESLLASEFSTEMSVKHKMQSIIFDRMTFESKERLLKLFFPVEQFKRVLYHLKNKVIHIKN